MSEHNTRAGREENQKRFNNQSSGKSYFFGIGINAYQHFDQLNNAVKDVADIAKLLEDRYDVEEVITLFDAEATRTNILAKLGALTKSLHSGDKLIIFYSGHGYLDYRKRGYWIPVDAKQGQDDTYITNSRVSEYLEDMKSRHTLLISDACFSGTLLNSSRMRAIIALDEMERMSSRWVMCSGRANEVVADGEPGGNSPFAASILHNLTQNQALKLNVVKLADEVKKQTSSIYHQLPMYGPLRVAAHKGGEYIFHLKKGAEAAWAEAQLENSLIGYARFFRLYPTSIYAEKALLHIENLEKDYKAWEIAQKENSITSYSRYISNSQMVKIWIGRSN